MKAGIRLIGYLCAAFAAHFICAAVPVEDRSSDRVVRSSQSVTSPRIQSGQDVTNTSDGRLTELFYQLQQLGQEVQMLRGLVEEQGYQLKRLSKDQKEQYLDLDQRIANMTSSGMGNPAGSPAVANSGSPPQSTNNQNGAVTDRERDAYANAFNMMKGQQFTESVAAFNRLIAQYPNGVYTPNAFYWLGELHLATSELELSRQFFVQVINLYPQHQKASDTLYKLGVVYHRLGDPQRALEFLQRVQDEYPTTPAAGLANSYAEELR